MTTINIKGAIITNGQKWIYDWFEEDSTCPNDVIKNLPDNSEKILVIINSGGGYVSAGNEIYTALKSYQGEVEIHIIAAGSAASVIAMAGDKGNVKMSPVGTIMIHNVKSSAAGDYHDMDKSSEVLQKFNKALSTAYQIKTGMSEAELLALMDEETWLTAEEAKEKGFIDEILFSDDVQSLIADNAALMPENIVNKMQALKNEVKTITNTEEIEKIVLDIMNKKNISAKNSEPEKPKVNFARFLF